MKLVQNWSSRVCTASGAGKMYLFGRAIFTPGTKVVKEYCDSSAVYASATNAQDVAQCRSISGSVLAERSAASGKSRASVRKKPRTGVDCTELITAALNEASEMCPWSILRRFPKG